MLITDRFSRRADIFPATATEFTAEDTANILVNKYIPLWGCPRTILSDNGLQVFSKLSQAVYQLLGVRNLATSSYNPNGNGGVEWVNCTMAQMLAMVINERQDGWDLQLPHVEFAYNNSVSAATGLAPNEVHKGRLPHLPLTVFERTGVAGHQESGPRPPGLLRLGYRPTAARKRHCSQTPCPHHFSRYPPKLRPRRRTASDT